MSNIKSPAVPPRTLITLSSVSALYTLLSHRHCESTVTFHHHIDLFNYCYIFYCLLYKLYCGYVRYMVFTEVGGIRLEARNLYGYRGPTVYSTNSPTKQRCAQLKRKNTPHINMEAQTHTYIGIHTHLYTHKHAQDVCNSAPCIRLLENKSECAWFMVMQSRSDQYANSSISFILSFLSLALFLAHNF